LQETHNREVIGEIYKVLFMIIRKDYIPLYKGIDLSHRRLPLMLADSGMKGPTVWVTAAIHGDEVTGTAVVLSLFDRFKNLPLLRGKVYAFPILNPSGFEAVSRHDVFEEEDLNRHFDMFSSRSLSKLHAGIILGSVMETKPSYVIDLHTDSLNSIAYILIDRPKILTNKKTLFDSIGLAKILGFPWAIDTDRQAGYPLEKCFTGRLITEGIPAVTIELGGPLYINDEFRSQGLTAVWNVLSSLSMVKGQEREFDNSEPKNAYYIEQRIRTESTGIISYRVKPGKHVREGEILGKVRNVFGETIEIIRASSKGVVFSHEDQSIAFPGQTMFTIAVEKSFHFSSS
jgi:uncharacterized protein